MSVEKITQNEFEKEQPLSGGNLYQTRLNLKKQKQFNENTMPRQIVKDIQNTVKKTVTQYVSESVPEWWVLMSEQANYFCNQFKWDINDIQIKQMIIRIIRAAFYSGYAGLYYNDLTDTIEAVSLCNFQYDAGGNITKASYVYANYYLNGIREQNKEFMNIKGVYDIPEEKLANLAVFQWGTEGLSAWIRLLPYVNEEHRLLKMMSTQSFAYLKKFVYNCNNREAVLSEMEAFFDDENPFILSIGAGENNGMGNRFEEVNISSGAKAMELLEYYKEKMAITYSKIGRRQNVDVKKERNITGEVEASQENFDVLFNDVNVQFEIFVEKANKILSNAGKDTINLIEEQEVTNEVSGDNKEMFSQKFGNGLS